MSDAVMIDRALHGRGVHSRSGVAPTTRAERRSCTTTESPANGTRDRELVQASICNLARFDLVSIRLAVFCAKSGSLSAAARLANMSLSGASHRLANLEDSFGAQLFIRTRLGLRPTESGEILVNHGLSLLDAIDQLSSQLALAQA